MNKEELTTATEALKGITKAINEMHGTLYDLTQVLRENNGGLHSRLGELIEATKAQKK